LVFAVFAVGCVLGVLAVPTTLPARSQHRKGMGVRASTSARLVYTQTLNEWEIYRARPDGSSLTRITSGGRSEYPAASPDGLHVAYSHFVDGSWELFVADAAGGNQQRLTENPGSFD